MSGMNNPPLFGVAGCLSSGFNLFIVLSLVPAALAITVKSALFSIWTTSYLRGFDLGILKPYFSGFFTIIAADK